MNPQRAFVRKIIYVAAICLLLIPLYLLAHPTTAESPGGMLARLREKNGLSEAQLGQLDSTSEAMKLATFGMRGVAANILWEKANRYKMKKDWTNLSATLNVLAELEPHFISVWKFQSWNLTYNVSTEFDDYRDRYRWVIAGIEFLIRGIGYNEKEPRLYGDVGWYLSHKIGKADEATQFRRLFRADDEFHARHHTPSPELRDNWLVGKDWFRRSEDLVNKGADLKGKSEVLFFSDKPMCQMYYAEALEDEGTFGEKARLAWADASRDWTDYGNHPINTIYDDGHGNVLKIALNDLERYRQQSRADMAALVALDPGLAEQIRWERWNGLTEAERGSMLAYFDTDVEAREDDISIATIATLNKRLPDWRQVLLRWRRAALSDEENTALDSPPFRRTAEQRKIAQKADDRLNEMARKSHEKLQVTPMDIARRITGPQRKRALALGESIQKADGMLSIIHGEREIVAFDHWRRRARVEQTDGAREARRLLYEGKRAFDQGNLNVAAESYRKGMAKWLEVAKNPEHALLVYDRNNFRDVLDAIDDYVKVLEQRDEMFPEDFALGEYLHGWVEANSSTQEARDAVTEADRAVAEGDSAAAKEAYSRALDSFRDLFNERTALSLMADRQLASEIMDVVNRYSQVLTKRGESFPDQWSLRGFLHNQLEHSGELADARDAAAEAAGLVEESKFPAAQEAYERALAQWRKLLDRYPCLMRLADRAAASELARTIQAYQTVLQHRGKSMPDDFILRDFLEAAGKQTEAK